MLRHFLRFFLDVIFFQGVIESKRRIYLVINNYFEIRVLNTLPEEFLKPRCLQPENEIEIKILQSGGLINLSLRFVSCAAM